METAICSLCHHNQSDPFISAQNIDDPTDIYFELKKCRNCDLIFETPRPSRQNLSAYYNDDQYYSYRELENKKKQNLGIFERIRHYFFEQTIAYYYGQRRSVGQYLCAAIGKGRFGASPKNLKPGRILDIGCGDGVFLDLVKDLGWEPYGVELSEKAARRASVSGLKVRAGDLLSANFQENFFDVIRIWSVLEHTSDPQEVLSEMRKILKPNGVLILQVPNIKSLAFSLFGRYWSGLDLPRHLTHYTPKTLRQALEKAGFYVIRLRSASVGTSLASLNFWMQQRKIPKGVFLKFFVYNCNPILRLMLIIFDRVCDILGIGDCMYVWAKKR